MNVLKGFVLGNIIALPISFGVLMFTGHSWWALPVGIAFLIALQCAESCGRRISMDEASQVADDATIRNVACQLRLIANDLRAAGDIPLVRFDEEGVAPDPLTLADELWLAAACLDPVNKFANARKENE